MRYWLESFVFRPGMDVSVKITSELYDVDGYVLRRFSANERNCIANEDGIKFEVKGVDITEYSQERWRH